MKPKDPSKPHGPVAVHDVTIEVDTDLCTGAASCMAVAAKAFHVNPGEKAIILDTADQEDLSVLIEAAKACPTAAIFIKDSSGKQIYPA